MNGWTDEQIEMLKVLFAKGLSSSQISKEIGGGLSRSAVIGKVHRLGLAGKATPSAPVRAAAKPKPAQPSLRVIGDAVFEEAEARLPREVVPERAEAPGSATLLTLEGRMCKWPIGDPASDTFTFCGRRREEGSYCATHARVAFQPPKGGKVRAQRDLTRSLRRYL